MPSGTPIDVWHLFQGIFYDEEFGSIHLDGAYYASARTYIPGLGRFMQRDPNGQALMLSSALSMNAQTRRVFPALSPDAQYYDGLILYVFTGNNPNTERDPEGTNYADWLAFSGGAIAGYLYASRTLTVNDKEAKWLRMAAGGYGALAVSRNALILAKGRLFGRALEKLREAKGYLPIWLVDMAFKYGFWRRPYGPAGFLMARATNTLRKFIPDLIVDSIVRTNQHASFWLDLPTKTKPLTKPIAALSGYIAGIYESALLLAEDAFGGIR